MIGGFLGAGKTTCVAKLAQQLTAETMALPLSERVSLAQTLWQSIDAGLVKNQIRAKIPNCGQ